MYYYINGTIKIKNPSFAVVDVNGVGYKLIISTKTFEILPPIGEKFLFYTYFHVREDIQRLFGFDKENQKDFFIELMKVNGIGPSQALGILSASTVENFLEIIKNNDKTKLTKIPGIGPKKAEKILFELKDIVKKISKGFEPTSTDPSLNEVSNALIALGYKDKEIDKVLLKLKKDKDKPIEQLIKKAISMLF